MEHPYQAPIPTIAAAVESAPTAAATRLVTGAKRPRTRDSLSLSGRPDHETRGCRRRGGGLGEMTRARGAGDDRIIRRVIALFAAGAIAWAAPSVARAADAEQLQFAAHEHDLGYRAYVAKSFDEAATHFENAYFAAPNPAELRSAIRARREAGGARGPRRWR